MLSITINFLKRALTCECWPVVLSRKSVYFGIGKRILYFYIVFMSHVLSTEYFQTVLSMFRFFAIDCTRKKTLLIKRISFVFLSRHRSVKPAICNG